MVISNKKLKKRLRSEAAQRQEGLPAATATASTSASTSTRVSFKSIPHKKREKKRQRLQQPENSPAQAATSPDTPIAQAEIETYHRCIETLLHEHNEAEGAHTEPQEIEAVVPKQKDATAVEDNSSLRTPAAKSRKRKKASEKNGRMEQQEEKATDKSAQDLNPNDPKTVYVGGIPYYSSEDDIRAFFGDCGTIFEVNLKTFSDTGKFRGIALLTFKTVEGAQRALALSGANMGDRFLKIQPSAAKPKEVVKKEVYNVPPSKTEGYTRAYVGNLSWDITEQDIRDFFKDCKIDSVRFSQDKLTGDFQGFGHVDFADDQSLELALQLDQQILLERPIKVAYAVPNRSEKKVGTVAKDRKDIACYSCGEKGHKSSHCPYMGRGT